MQKANNLWRESAYKSTSRFIKEYKNLSNKIYHNSLKIKDGYPISVWMHQPNILSSTSVLSSAIELYKYSKLNNTIPVFIIIDYDEAGDQRFRSPCLPALHNSNKFKYFLNGAVSKVDRKKIANVLKINNCTLDLWNDKYRNNLNYWLNHFDKRVCHKNKSYDKFCFYRNNLITHASTIQILKDLEDIGIQGIVPVFASDIWNSIYIHVLDTILSSKLISKIENSKIIWWVCEKCKERKVCTIHTDLIVESICDNCDIVYSKNVADISSTEILPRHELCNIIDIMFCNPQNFFLYDKSQYHFEKTCSIISLSESISSRIYTSVNNFPLPVNNNAFTADSKNGVFSMRFMLDLFHNEHAQLVDNILTSINTRVVNTYG